MTGARKPYSQKYLARVEDGWQLRVPPWLPGGGGYTRFFGDSAHGSADLALEAARASRDRMFEHTDMPLDPGGKRQFGRSPTLIAGVCLARSGRHPKVDVRGLYWSANWNEDGRQRRRLFSVLKLGFVEAWEAAVAERLRRVEHEYSEAEMLQARAQALMLWAQYLQGQPWGS